MLRFRRWAAVALIGAAVLLAAGSTLASPFPRPELRAARTDAAPDIDGRLADAAWSAAEPSSAFTQKFPDEGAAPTERTSVRVLYDDRNLYVGIDCAQTSSPLVPRMARRDREIETDRVTVSIDSRRDGVSAFEFVVTATGVLRDGLRFDDTEESWEWDENWEAKTRTSAGGWSVEMRIPLRILRFEKMPVQEWGFNVRRVITARQELAEWSFVPRTVAGEVSHYGRLTNLHGLAPATQLELRPFVAAKTTRWDPGYGPREGYGHDLSAGIDAKLHPSQSLTLDATLFPDFGQVEADQVVLNLTTTETSHPEKRPFFLEGGDIFATPQPVLYTRRIGRAPGGPPRLAGEEVADVVAPSPIWGAGKLGGRVGGLGLGLLSAVTGPNHVPVRRADGELERRLADPLTTFNVLRLKHDVGRNGHLGVIGTATNRVGTTGALAVVDADGLVLCPGGARVAPGRDCFRDAYVGGIDGRWRSPSGAYALSGQALATGMAGGPARTLRDGTVIASGDVAPVLDLGVAKEGGEHWLWDVSATYVGRKADFNDLGFLERQNLARGTFDLIYRTTRPWAFTLGTKTDLEVEMAHNLDGLLIERAIDIDTTWTLWNFWNVQVGTFLSLAHFDDREMGRGAAIERPMRWGFQVEVETDPRARVYAKLEAKALKLPEGHQFELEGGLRLRVLPRLDVDLDPEIELHSGEPRFVERTTMPGATNYLFGNLEARSLGATLRATFTFTPTLTLQAYGQLFLVAKHYSRFQQVTSAEARPVVRLADLTPATPPADNPDEQEAVLNINVLLRWEYRLGSTLFLAYTRAQLPEIELDPGVRGVLDVRRVGRAPAAHAILLKLSYFWS